MQKSSLMSFRKKLWSPVQLNHCYFLLIIINLSLGLHPIILYFLEDDIRYIPQLSRATHNSNLGITSCTIGSSFQIKIHYAPWRMRASTGGFGCNEAHQTRQAKHPMCCRASMSVPIGSGRNLSCTKGEVIQAFPVCSEQELDGGVNEQPYLTRNPYLIPDSPTKGKEPTNWVL